MASDLDTRSPPHLSIARMVSAGTRNAIMGSLPVAGRPGFLLDITFDRFPCIIGLYLKVGPWEERVGYLESWNRRVPRVP